jgi:hypothetical protein
MRVRLHIRPISCTPDLAQSNFQIKLESVTSIIDTLMLATRAAPWKVFDFSGEAGTTDTTDTTGDTGGLAGGA